MILTPEQAIDFNTELKTMYSLNRDYTNLFKAAEKFVILTDKPVTVKRTSDLIDQRVRETVEGNRHVEEEFISMLHCHNNRPDAEYELNDDSRYDLKISYQGTEEPCFSYIELKDDRRAIDTGNVVIEFESRKKPSGISITESTQWVIRVEGFYIVMRTEALKKLVNKNTFPIVKGGDDYTSKLYKIKMDDILKIASHIIVDEYSKIYE